MTSMSELGALGTHLGAPVFGALGARLSTDLGAMAGATERERESGIVRRRKRKAVRT